MNSIKLKAPSYRELKNLYTAKEIYIPDQIDLTPK